LAQRWHGTGTFQIFDQHVKSLTDVSGKVFFVSNGPANPNQLWTTDGLTVTLLTATPETGYFSSAASLVNVNGTLFLQGFTGLGIAIYSSDGTVAARGWSSSLPTSFIRAD
jgi:hypothetical protein